MVEYSILSKPGRRVTCSEAITRNSRHVDHTLETRTSLKANRSIQ